jgi:hypothetical protein
VGNDCVDDNIAECAQVALWNALKSARGRVKVSLAEGHATLSGRVRRTAEREAAELAIRALNCVNGITNDIVVEPSARGVRHEAPIALSRRSPSQLLYVTRFCSLEEASVTAATKDAIAVLNNLLGNRKPSEFIVRFYNQHADTITLDVGCRGRLPAGIDIGEVHVGKAPTGLGFAVTPPEGFAGLMNALDRLREQVNATQDGTVADVWQVLPANADPLAAGWPSTPIHLNADRVSDGVARRRAAIATPLSESDAA